MKKFTVRAAAIVVALGGVLWAVGGWFRAGVTLEPDSNYSMHIGPFVFPEIIFAILTIITAVGVWKEQRWAYAAVPVLIAAFFLV